VKDHLKDLESEVAEKVFSAWAGEIDADAAAFGTPNGLLGLIPGSNLNPPVRTAPAIACPPPVIFVVILGLDGLGSTIELKNGIQLLARGTVDSSDSGTKWMETRGLMVNQCEVYGASGTVRV
jgi:hypothetical protein